MDRPAPPRRDGWPAWFQVLLGLAGILVTVAGVISLEKAMTPKPTKVPAPVVTTADEQARLDRLTAERRAMDRRRAQAKPDPDYLPGRPEVLNSRELEAKGFRCISGQLFRKVGNEWQQLGRC